MKAGSPLAARLVVVAVIVAASLLALWPVLPSLVGGEPVIYSRTLGPGAETYKAFVHFDALVSDLAASCADARAAGGGAWAQLSAMADCLATAHVRHMVWNVVDMVVMFMPLEALFGRPGFWNAGALVILLGNGLAAYVLARRAGAARVPAVVAALLLMLSFHVLENLHEGRPLQAFVAPLCLFVAAWLEVLRAPGWRSGLVAGGLLTLTALFYWFYGLFAVLAALCLTVARLIEAPGELRRLLVASACCGLVTFYLCLPSMLAMASAASDPAAPVYAPRHRVFPSPTQALELRTGDRLTLQDSMLAEGFISTKLSPEASWRCHATTFLSLGVLELAAMAFLARPLPWPWLAVLGLSWLLALGPYVQTTWAGDHQYLMRNPLYGAAYTWVPFFSRLNHPERFIALAWVALVPLVSLGLMRAAAWWAARRMPPMLCTALLVLMVAIPIRSAFQAGHLPLSAHATALPPRLGEVFQGEGLVAHLPLAERFPYYDAQRMHFLKTLQFFHRHPVLLRDPPSRAGHFEYENGLQPGWHGRINPRDEVRYVWALRTVSGPASEEELEKAVSMLRSVGVRWLLADDWMARVDARQAAEAGRCFHRLTQRFGAPAVLMLECSSWGPERGLSVLQGTRPIQVFDLQAPPRPARARPTLPLGKS